MSASTRTVRLVVVTAALQSLSLAGTVGALRAAVDQARRADVPTPDPAAGVLASVEALAWLGLALCGAWFAAAVLASARDIAHHPSRPLPRAARSCLRPPLVRTLLVVLVGGCLVTPTVRPVADQGPGWAVLDGLPLPALPTGPAVVPAPPNRPRFLPRHVEVRPGDSLWSLTEGLLGTHSTAAAVARGWPLLHAANRARIGPDPDLVLPGTTLRVPTDLVRPTRPRPGAAR